ncbi:helix-turn-helix transcriptional regulator [Embleya sp. AB8]|uniref:helix-turn-helix transcriptional regulator n=1 Tax=Embleya sp. AB8 TaxID=3156304 RepID=UPI003C790E5E
MDLLRITAVHPPENGDAPPVDTQVFTDLSTTIHARAELRFDYVQDRKAATAAGQQRRRVQPHHLVAWRGHWYLLAWDLDRDDWRTFRVDRIHPRISTGPRFTLRELPGGDVPAFITSRFRGSDDITTDWPCRGEVVLGSWSWTGLAAAIGGFDRTSKSSAHPNSTPPSPTSPPATPTPPAQPSRPDRSGAASGIAMRRRGGRS